MIENIIRKLLNLNNKEKELHENDNIKKFDKSIIELEKLTRELQDKDAELKEYYKLIEKENSILIKASRGEQFEVILKSIVDTIENYNEEDNVLANISIYNENDNKLYDLCSPNLPYDYYKFLLNGLDVGLYTVSCGTAAYNKKITMVNDIKESSYWDSFPEIRDAALRNNIIACYSSPILGNNNKLLGTLAIHFKDDSFQDKVYKNLLCWSAKITSIIIERKNNEKLISKNYSDIEQKNKLLESIVDASGGYLWMKDESHRYKFCDYNYQYDFFGERNKKNIIGKNDEDLIKEYKTRTDKDHQFRHICMITDEYTKNKKDQCRYIEGGYINGDLLIFEVIKTPLFDLNGKYRGIVGFSWNRTEEVDIVFKDINLLKQEGRIEVLSESEYPKTPFIYYIIPNKKYYKRLISRPIYDDSSIIDKRVIIEESY